MPETFIKRVLGASKSHAWIKSVEQQHTGKVAKLKLVLGDDQFVAVFYNSHTGSTSYAYIERGVRLFGANNMKIGWHLHPWGDDEKHIASDPLTINQFLLRLEKHLRESQKLC